MKNDLNFTDFLKDVFSSFDKKLGNSGLVSICIAIPCIDLFHIYEFFINKYSFSSFWEEADGISYIALDKCKYVTLEGPKKFEVAKEFNSENFKNLINLTEKSNIDPISKIIYFFSFSENLKKKHSFSDVPTLEAVLPKILIIKKDNNCWLRINGHVEGESSLRNLVEDLWLIKNQILDSHNKKIKTSCDPPLMNEFLTSLETSNENLKQLINKGINLVEEGILEKIVLAKRIKLKLSSELDIIRILKRLKTNHPNTCRYVWKRNNKDIIFGASPEQLFYLIKPNLILYALAGTASSTSNLDSFLKSSKDLKEHNYVIEYLIKCLEVLNIKNYKKSDVKVNQFGDISHLQTLIHSKVENMCPFELLKTLHPSPAVCGSPKKEALDWIIKLESFSRGNYASPIGWVDSSGNSQFLLAIRGARYLDNSIEFTAGAGLVKGSSLEKEIDEIKLKLRSLAKQIFFVETTK